MCIPYEEKLEEGRLSCTDIVLTYIKKRGKYLKYGKHIPVNVFSVLIHQSFSIFAFIKVKMMSIFFKGRSKGADSISHTACVLVFWLAGGAAEVNQPAARVQRASDRLHPGPGVAGIGPWGGCTALQLRLWLQKGDYPWPHRVSVYREESFIKMAQIVKKCVFCWLFLYHNSS